MESDYIHVKNVASSLGNAKPLFLIQECIVEVFQIEKFGKPFPSVQASPSITEFIVERNLVSVKNVVKLLDCSTLKSASQSSY